MVIQYEFTIHSQIHYWSTIHLPNSLYICDKTLDPLSFANSLSFANPPSFSRIHHGSIIYFANSPWIHISRIHNSFAITLWIHYVFRESAICTIFSANSQFIRDYTIDPLSISWINYWFIVKVRANGSYKWKIENVEIKGFAPTPCISLVSSAWVAMILNQELCLSLLANKAPEEREIKGVGANPLTSTFSIFHL